MKWSDDEELLEDIGRSTGQLRTEIGAAIVIQKQPIATAFKIVDPRSTRWRRLTRGFCRMHTQQSLFGQLFGSAADRTATPMVDSSFGASLSSAARSFRQKVRSPASKRSTILLKPFSFRAEFRRWQSHASPICRSSKSSSSLIRN